MRSARQSAIRLLQLMMVASVVLPVVLFAFAAWLNYRHEYAVADDRIERSLDILHEHTLKVFQAVERAIAEVNEIVRGMSDDDIRRDQLHLHEQLKHIVDALPQVRAIFLFYALIGHSPGSLYALLRADGRFLARYPERPDRGLQ